MHALFDFLLRNGYWVLFLNVLGEQVGLPIPAAPVLLAMGALSGLGSFSFLACLLIAVGAALTSDVVWYRLGATRGGRILALVCRMSLEPDSCVSNTKNMFAKWGALSFLFAKWVPGLGAVAAPLAGLTQMRPAKFLVADLAGCIAWSGGYLGLGWIFRDQIERVAESAGRTGTMLVIVVVCGLAAYIGLKYYQRQRFIRDLRVARVSVDELKRMIDAAEDVAVVDLRSALEFEYEGQKIPGAIRIDLEEMETRHEEIPREKEIILYCS